MQEPVSEEMEDRSLQKAQGVVSMFLVFLGLLLILGGSKIRNPLFGWSSVTLGMVTLGVSVRRSLRHQLTANDIVEGLTETLVDDFAEAFTFTGNEGHRITANLDPIILSKLPDRIKAAIPPEVENQSWFHDEGFWIDSKYIAGAKGSGKSFLLAYESCMTLKARPDARLYILDPHLGDESDWFGGNGDLIDRYCYKVSRKPEQLEIVTTIIDEFYAEFDDRIDTGDRSRPLLKMIWDEWEACIKILERVPCESGSGFNNYREKLLDLDERVQDEGRKFQVEITNGLHTFKKGRSGQDSDTVTQKHWIACGDALSQPNIKLPDNIPVKDLEADRLRIERLFVPEMFAKTAVIRANTTPRVAGFMKAVGVPYIDLDALEFEVEAEEEGDRIDQWIAQNKPEVERLYLSGVTTLRKLSDRLRVQRRNDNWEYAALKQCIQEVILEQATKGHQKTLEIVEANS